MVVLFVRSMRVSSGENQTDESVRNGGKPGGSAESEGSIRQILSTSTRTSLQRSWTASRSENLEAITRSIVRSARPHSSREGLSNGQVGRRL
jgi:hypothetical protein